MSNIVIKEESPEISLTIGDDSCEMPVAVATATNSSTTNINVLKSSPKLKLRPKEQLLKTMKKSIAGKSDAATSCDNASPGLLCGEIFVTRSARKWTFMCTHCNKGTRDIGEFVCHIKLKHLTHAYDDDYDSADIEESTLMTDEASDKGHEESQERDVRNASIKINFNKNHLLYMSASLYTRS